MTVEERFRKRQIIHLPHLYNATDAEANRKRSRKYR
jgi:hypothetical protein